MHIRLNPFCIILIHFKKLEINTFFQSIFIQRDFSRFLEQEGIKSCAGLTKLSENCRVVQLQINPIPIRDMHHCNVF